MRKRNPQNSLEQSPAFDEIPDHRIAQPFNRFGLDIIGGLFITTSVITLIGLWNWTHGSLIDWWITAIRRLFGSGAYFVVLTLLAFGIDSLHVSVDGQRKIKLTRILQLEAMAFCLLPLLSIYHGHALDYAILGKGGGIIGWGLAELLLLILPKLATLFVLFILAIFFFLSGSGLLQIISRGIDRWSQRFLARYDVEEETFTDELPDQTIQPPAVEQPLSPFEAEFDADAQSTIQPAKNKKTRTHLPPPDLLSLENTVEADEEHIRVTAEMIEQTFQEFQIPARVVGYRVGPTVTQYAVEPGFIEKSRPDGSIYRQKIRISQISRLSRDLARALSAERLRIEAPVPGHSFVGIEVANPQSTTVRLRSMLEAGPFKKMASKPLALALGRDVSGEAVVADLASMPHLLIAGTTGSGKSVCMEAITTCLIMNNSPQDLRLAMLDPKMVELIRFNSLPHLLGKVETELDRMLTVLRWALVEMENRYRLLQGEHARDLDAYNRKMKRQNRPRLPRIVILIDELADLMMIAPEQTEDSLTRLAQKARATGIHLVVATQRPSTDVVTGLIKANFPARIAFQVATGIDSRVVIDTQGAEELLGNGDMLYLDPSVRAPIRAQGVLVSDHEIEKLIEFWKEQYTREDEPQPEAPWEPMFVNNGEDSRDSMLDEAIEVVRKTGRASASMLQRRLRVGYPRAASIIDQLEEIGVIGPAMSGGRDREVLIGDEDDDLDDASERAEGKRFENSHPLADEDDSDLNEV